MATPDWFREYFAEPYGEIYAEYLLPPDITLEEAQLVLDALELSPGARILDCPCGYGRHMEHFGLLFPDVIGLDLERDCLRRAAEAMPGGAIAQGDMRRLPFQSERFDAVVHLFNSFGYFSHEENEALLAEFARVLKPSGGRVLIDIANPEPLIDIIREQSRTQQQVVDLLLTEDWRYDDETRILHNDTRIELQGESLCRSYDVRVYTISEMAEMLGRAGLEIVQAFGNFDGEAYDEADSSRMILVAER